MTLAPVDPDRPLDGEAAARALFKILWTSSRRLIPARDEADRAIVAFVEQQARDGWADGSFGASGDRVLFQFRDHAFTSAAFAVHLLEGALAWELPKLDANAEKLGFRVQSPRPTLAEMLALPRPQSFVPAHHPHERGERYFSLSVRDGEITLFGDGGVTGELGWRESWRALLLAGECRCSACFALRERHLEAERAARRAAKGPDGPKPASTSRKRRSSKSS